MITRAFCRIAFLVSVTAVVLLVSAWPQARQRTNSDFLVTNVRVFDGASALQNTHVAVTGGIIRAIGGNLTDWRTLPTVDGTNSTLMPGLIDAHVHVRDADDLRQALRFGVTTVLDMAATRSTEADLFRLRAIANAASDMADLRSAGFPATAPDAHGTEFATAFPTVGSVTDATQFVAARRAEGSDYLKLILNGLRSATAGTPNLDHDRTKALVAAAHTLGLLAVAHVETLEDTDMAASAGIDGLVHVWRRGAANPEMARRLAARNIFVIPALAIPDGFLPEGRAGLLADRRLTPWLSNSIQDHLGRSFASPTVTDDTRRARLAESLAATRSLHAAGVRLLAGTDASPGNPSAQGISVHRELELLSDAGLRPSETLATATANTADAFRLTDRGRILVGRRADLLLVTGDPTSDLLTIRSIARIWKAGVSVDRVATLR